MDQDRWIKSDGSELANRAFIGTKERRSWLGQNRKSWKTVKIAVTPWRSVPETQDLAVFYAQHLYIHKPVMQRQNKTVPLNLTNSRILPNLISGCLWYPNKTRINACCSWYGWPSSHQQNVWVSNVRRVGGPEEKKKKIECYIDKGLPWEAIGEE